MDKFTRNPPALAVGRFNSMPTTAIAKQLEVGRRVICKCLTQMEITIKRRNGKEHKYPVTSRGTKVCYLCKKEKPVTEFYYKRDNRVKSYCKLCDKDKTRRIHLRTKYNISLEEYDLLREKQNGVCAICAKPETRKIKGVISQLAVDHDHITEKIRGLLCRRCNRAIGWLDDDPALLVAAFNYLRVGSSNE